MIDRKQIKNDKVRESDEHINNLNQI